MMMLERLGQPLGGLALLVVQIGRDHELEDNVLVAAPAAPKRREPASAEDGGLSMLGSRRHLDGDLSLQRRHEDLAADDRGGDRDLGPRDQLGPLASEPLVCLDADLHIKVALTPPCLSGVPGATDSHPLAVLDAGGDVDLPGPGLGYPARAAAALARRLRDAAVATTAVARHRPDHLAEDAAADLPQLSRPLALRTGLNWSTRLGAVAPAAFADDHRVEGDLTCLVLEHILQADLDDGPDVRARRRPSAEAAERIAAAE
jgi:hypothetical protein